MKGLRGRVVLIDFWTYSCINCLRTLPHIRDWDDRYRAAGLTIVGVHTPEFAFERVASNVRENVKKLELRYPVALDNGFGTWEAWHNQYWPAKYLIDRNGHVRYFHFGEGEYGTTEEAIRTLLGSDAPPASGLADDSPHGAAHARELPRLPAPRQQRRRGRREGRRAHLPAAGEARRQRARLRRQLEGRGRAGGRRARARGCGSSTAPATSTSCSPGRARCECSSTASRSATVRVTDDRLYTLVERPKIGDHLLELRFSPGVAGYAFTFG